MRIIESLAIAATPTISGAAGAGSGAANLLTFSPREIWVSSAVGLSVIDIDLGALKDVDGFFLGFTNASTAATWSIQKGTGLGTGLTTIQASTTFRAADSLGPTHHGFVALAAAHNARYFRLNVTQTGAAPLQAGILMVGKVFTSPYEHGGGRVPIDTSVKEPLPDGGFGIGEGVVKAGLRWKFVDLTPAQRRTLWRLVYARGEAKPVVVQEDTGEGEGLNEELHYGLFDRFEPYEREAPGATKWALSMTEWG